ncbi:MAG: HIG1 domain-containing protein [Proteobacteria bacterium]|nr:HIG1 domain-containing protein [Pseudomonadota bacterium]
MLKSVLAVLIAMALAATLLILLAGVFGMLRGTRFNDKYGNVMMRARVTSQAVTILLLVAYFLAP